MERTNSEEELLDQGLEALRKETGLVGRESHARLGIVSRQWDGEITLAIPGQSQKLNFAIEIKKNVSRATVGAIAYKFSGVTNDSLLVTTYVNAELARELKDLKIQFIDTVGNAYINKHPVYIYVKGEKSDLTTSAVTSRAFSKKGMMVLFALLCNPGLESLPLRRIAEVSNVALGTVNAVFNSLFSMGYLLNKGKYGRVLLHKKKILERWVGSYQDTLRPKLFIGNFTAKNKYWWKEALLPEQYCWGSEVAASQLTGYLKPEIVTVYASGPIDKFLVMNKIRKEEEGEIELLHSFWNWELLENFDHSKLSFCAHPLLIYADLIMSTDIRNHDAARILYNEYINEFIR